MRRANGVALLLCVIGIVTWMGITPTSARASEREVTLQHIRTAVKEVRKEAIQRMTSPQAAQAYVNFAKFISSPTFVNRTNVQTVGCKQSSCTDAQVKAYFHAHISKKIVEAIPTIPVFFEDSGFPEHVKKKFEETETLVGSYYTKTNVIYLSSRNLEGHSLQSITEVVREEYEHAIDRNIIYRDLFPKTQHPDAKMIYAQSKILHRVLTEGLIRPELSGTYQAEPREFYAKFQVIKTALRQKQPGFFYANGNIRRKAARRFLRSAMKYLDWGEIDIYAWNVVDKSKVDEFKLFMDMLV
jgi:hypothetical protein